MSFFSGIFHEKRQNNRSFNNRLEIHPQSIEVGDSCKLFNKFANILIPINKNFL